MTGPRRAPRRSATDPYGLAAVGGLVSPLLAAGGLVVVAIVTFSLLTGNLLFAGRVGGGGGDGPARTPTPSNVVVVDPLADVPGSIVYIKAGNIWIQSGKSVRQLTTTGKASMPTWSPDGSAIYYIESVDQRGKFPAGGQIRVYNMTVPKLMRIPVAGGAPEQLATGLYHTGPYTWFYWLREPAVSPDGKTVALVSDAPDPTKSSVVLQLFNLQTKKLTRPKLSDNYPLGHQDPAWRPDGKQLLYVRNGTSGSRGAPVIVRYDPLTKKASALTGAGYSTPAWSRDGLYLAATRTDSFGTNVVILDGRRGTEILRLTTDDRSWAPVWSPKGDAISFLHLQDGVVDLRMIPLDGNAPNWKSGKVLDLTQSAGLDGASRPGWFVPADQLPPLPTPTPAATPSAAAGSASSAP